jgi:hypothetical protein
MEGHLYILIVLAPRDDTPFIDVLACAFPVSDAPRTEDALASMLIAQVKSHYRARGLVGGAQLRCLECGEHATWHRPNVIAYPMANCWRPEPGMIATFRCAPCHEAHCDRVLRAWAAPWIPYFYCRCPWMLHFPAAHIRYCDNCRKAQLARLANGQKPLIPDGEAKFKAG